MEEEAPEEQLEMEDMEEEAREEQLEMEDAEEEAAETKQLEMEDTEDVLVEEEEALVPREPLEAPPHRQLFGPSITPIPAFVPAMTSHPRRQGTGGGHGKGDKKGSKKGGKGDKKGRKRGKGGGKKGGKQPELATWRSLSTSSTATREPIAAGLVSAPGVVAKAKAVAANEEQEFVFLLKYW